MKSELIIFYELLMNFIASEAQFEYRLIPFLVTGTNNDGKVTVHSHILLENRN